MSRINSLIFVFVLLCALPGIAQKLTWRDFEACPQDMDTQSITIEKSDRDGRPTAVIKIFTSIPSSELTFGGSARGLK